MGNYNKKGKGDLSILVILKSLEICTILQVSGHLNDLNSTRLWTRMWVSQFLCVAIAPELIIFSYSNLVNSVVLG